MHGSVELTVNERRMHGLGTTMAVSTSSHTTRNHGYTREMSLDPELSGLRQAISKRLDHYRRILSDLCVPREEIPWWAPRRSQDEIRSSVWFSGVDEMMK